MYNLTKLFVSVSRQVPNYLPSISASISLVPERYIWRCCIGLHSAPRFLMAAAYFNFYRGRFAKRLLDMLLSGLALICCLVENIGLLLLTYVASTETYSKYLEVYYLKYKYRLLFSPHIDFRDFRDRGTVGLTRQTDQYYPLVADTNLITIYSFTTHQSIIIIADIYSLLLLPLRITVNLCFP